MHLLRESFGRIPPPHTARFPLPCPDRIQRSSTTSHVKNWYEEGGMEIVVYDNGFDQPIGGGNIKVHSN